MLTAGIVGLASLPASSQAPRSLPLADRAAVLNAVLSHRVKWQRDSAAIEACGVYVALDSIPAFVRLIDSAYRAMIFTDPGGLCIRFPTVPKTDLATVEAIRVVNGDTVAVDMFSVKGEDFQRMTYSVVTYPGRPPVVFRVETSGFLRIHRPPLRRPPPVFDRPN